MLRDATGLRSWKVFQNSVIREIHDSPVDRDVVLATL
jgi:hypothetical protein